MKIPAAKAAVDKEWEKLEKISAWNLTKVKSKKQVIEEARTSGATVHFASLMDICHLKNAELEAKHQKYKGRVVLRGDIVKDNSGSYAVFTEQGSSASQMTAAKIMDIISRLPGCDGQAADAVSAYTQVKMEDAHKLLKIPKSECPDIWIRLPRHKWPKSWSSMEDPVVPLDRNLYGHPLAGLLWERQFEKVLLKHGWEKIPNWECLFVHREKGLFLSVYVEDIKLAGKKHNIDPMWKVLNKEVDLGEPTSFLDHVYLGCTQRQDQITLRNMVHLGLLKCGKVEMENTIDQGDLSKILGIHWKKLILFVKNIFSAEQRILQGTKKLFTKERGDPIQRIPRFIMGSDTTEFVNKVKNQVRIRQKRMSNVAEDCTEHSITWGMFMATTLNAATFMGKSYSTMRNVVQNGEKITLKQMFDITAQTINNDEEVYCLDKIEYQRNTWTQLSLINDPVVIGLQSAKVYVFSDSVLCLGKVLQHPECNQAWKDRVAGVRAEKNYSDFDDIKGESAEFEWNIFPGFTTLQLCDKTNNLLSSLGQTPEIFTGRILFMSMFNDISCEGKDNQQQCLRDADFVKTFAKRFGIGQWSFIGPGSEKKWYPSENSPQGEWDRIAEDVLLEFAKSGHPIFRATTPLSRGKLKSKGKGKVSIHFSAEPDTIDTIYRIILSANQLSIYGAVAAICEEFVGQPDNTGEPVILEGQSIVLGEVKAEVPAQEELEDSNIVLQKYFQQVQRLSPEDRLSKFCKEAGFMSVVEVGQYFVTRNASEFLLRSVACREYTLPRDDPASEVKGWIQGNTRIGPILEVTTTFQHFKFGVEVRIQSVKEDNSQSWVRISYGTIRYVNNYIKYNTHNFASSYEEKAEPTSSEVIAARSKAKAKPQPRESSGTTTISFNERIWIDIVPSKQDYDSHKVSKRVINLLRHNRNVNRERDGAVQFYKIKFLMRDHSLSTQNWSDNRWLACLAAGGGPKRKYQYCPDYLGSIIYLRALQGHSGDSIIDLSMQDHVLITPGIFPYVYHVGSNFNIPSILSNGLIPGGLELSGRQSVFFLPIDPRDENHQDPENIDYSVPRRARYVQNSWKRHQDTVFWIDIDHGIIKEGLRFYQTKSNAIILQGVLPPSCIVKAERLKGGEPLYKRQYLSPRPPPKIYLRNDLDWARGNDDLGSTVEPRPVGKLVQQSTWRNSSFRFFQANPIPQNQSRLFGETRSSRDCCWSVARRTTCPKSRQLRET